MRDKYLCVNCGKPAEEVHHKIHLTPQNIGDKSISLNPNNLICLCKDCHFEQHRTDRIKGLSKHKDDDYEYEFDSNGMLVRKICPPSP